jgi:hypothetical protein
MTDFTAEHGFRWFDWPDLYSAEGGEPKVPSQLPAPSPLVHISAGSTGSHLHRVTVMIATLAMPRNPRLRRVPDSIRVRVSRA